MTGTDSAWAISSVMRRQRSAMRVHTVALSARPDVLYS